MQITICDRCGDQIFGPGEEKNKKPRKYMIKRIEETPFKAVDGTKLINEYKTDLCPACQILFNEFMSGYREVRHK